MIKASKVRSLKLGMVAAVWLAAVPAWAQGGAGQPPAQPGQGPTGPAGQPQQPGVTVSSDGSVSGPTPGATEPEKDSAQTLKLPPKDAGPAPKPLIWAGTVFFANQSVNTEAVGVGKDYQTSNPSYQLWFSVRPRLTLYNGERDKLTFTGRLDMTKELTNADDTALYRQNSLGDAWLTFSYAHTFVKRNGWSTTLSTGPRVLLPTSLLSGGAQGMPTGTYVALGGGASLLQNIPLNRGSEWFASGRLLASAYYTHAFSDSTTPTNDEVARPRTTNNTNLSEISNQTSGGLLSEHRVLSVLDTGVQITPKLGFTVDTILIQNWRYKPTNADVTVGNATQRVQSSEKNQNPQRYSLATYFLTSIDYQLTDELNLSFDYYTVANTIGESGNRQNMFYSPQNSRFSMTATVSLDALYERIRGSEVEGFKKQGSRVAKRASNILSF